MKIANLVGLGAATCRPDQQQHRPSIWRRPWLAVGTVLVFSIAIALPSGAQAGAATDIDALDAVEEALEKVFDSPEVVPASLKVKGGVLRAELPESTTEFSSKGIQVSTETASFNVGFADGTPEWSLERGGFARTEVGGLQFIAAAYPSGISLMSVIAERPASSAQVELRFDLGIPTNASLELTDKGSVDVVGEQGVTVGAFDAPWALDAAGRSLATWYSLKGTELTQVVILDDETTFPIVADPHFDPGITSATLYFNRSETLAISYAVAAAGACIAFNQVPQPWGAIMAAGCALVWVHFVAMANVAVDQQKCVKFKVGVSLFGGAYQEVGLHDGNHCPSGGGSLPGPTK